MVDLPKYIVRRNEHNHYCILFKLEYLRATQNGMLGQVVETLESTRERWVVLMSKSWGGGRCSSRYEVAGKGRTIKRGGFPPEYEVWQI